MSDAPVKLELFNYEDHVPEGSLTTVRNKFVILKHRDIVALIMGPLTVFPYHAKLVERYCNDNDVPTAWVHKPDQLEVFDSEVQLKGGGQLDIYPRDKVLKIHGFSTAYGPYSNEYLKKFITGHPFFAAYSVRV